MLQAGRLDPTFLFLFLFLGGVVGLLLSLKTIYEMYQSRTERTVGD